MPADVPPSNRADDQQHRPTASAGVLYTFDYEARDLDGDALSWSLRAARRG